MENFCGHLHRSVPLQTPTALEEGPEVAIVDHIGSKPVAETKHFVGSGPPLEFDRELEAVSKHFV